MRKPIIAGNWKMNKTVSEAEQICQEIRDKIGSTDRVEIIICPPFTSLERVSKIIKDSKIELGAQNMYYQESGAYTGEISGQMLQEVSCTYVILGHSERRTYFRESNDLVNLKIKASFERGLVPIMCVGETLEEREAAKAEAVVDAQLEEGLKGVLEFLQKQDKDVIIAYEPVWAIGTGKVATPEQAQEMHAFIRRKLTALFGQEISEKIRVLYGGSVKPGNVSELAQQHDIDGALVGGASLDAVSFSQIVKNFY